MELDMITLECRRDGLGARFDRRSALRGLLAGALAVLTPWSALAATEESGDARFFRIGTGATSGTYFPIGREIASALSDSAGARDCARGGTCGIAGLIAVAQASQGSVENIEMLQKGELESALCQTDVASWAYAGAPPFLEPMPTLRALANLFSEAIHIIVRADSAIDGITDLAGKRVALGQPESGTLADARLILGAAGLSERDVDGNHDTLAAAEAGLKDGTVDAVFQIAGYPVSAIAELATDLPIRLLGIPAAAADTLTGQHGFFSGAVIPGGTYGGIDADTPTLAVGAEWVALASLDDNLAYQLVRALWNDSTLRLLGSGHPIGKRLRLANAVDGLALPLHPGAEKFYREIGLLERETSIGPG
jgi:uncharacterized protein